jgi:hypothetical protein
MLNETTPRPSSAMALLETGDIPDGEDGRRLREMARTERSMLLRDGVALRLVRRIATEIELDPDEEWQRYRVYQALSTAIWVRSDAELRKPETDESILGDMFDWIDAGTR